MLWIGTYDGGLNRFKDGKFTSYTMEDGLFSNGVFAILEDSRGNFWMSSNQGIYSVSKQQLNDFAERKIERIDSVSYGKADGMLNTECNGGRHPAAIKTGDGRMWFPTFNGVAVVDPEGHPAPLLSGKLRRSTLSITTICRAIQGTCYKASSVGASSR
ncbi:MAG TPA: two-component regulator propeller domain-containing protein [Blastocatellia bacterium]|nr:two-component regulator propeller domain-containing protein [Blastocatellia bacterium]